MARLIDANKLKMYIDTCQFCEKCPDIAFMCQRSCEFPNILTPQWERAIDEQPTVDAVPQWIPCSERLPSNEEDVLCDDEGRVTIGYYTDEKIGWHDMHSYRIYPNAWMPLPAPYERKEE